MLNSISCRSDYLNELRKWVRTPLVKVLVGLRRSGKSTLLNQWSLLMVQEGMVQASHLLLLECDSLEGLELRDWTQLRDRVAQFSTTAPGPKVLLIDEVQWIDGWEKVVVALHKQGDWDIYLTGSNSQMLSGELATLLSGRQVQILIQPFSYLEHLDIRGHKKHTPEEFQRFLRFGGIPSLYHLPDDDSVLTQTLESIFTTIVLRDVVERYKVRNVELLDRIVRFFFDNIGNLVNAKRIADYCKSQKLSVGVETVQNYVKYLESCFVVHRVQRNDLKGKRLLEINEKLFIGDVGLRNAILAKRTEDVGALLENLVFLELRRRGYQITVGIFGDYEIDFVADRAGTRHYFQVCYQMGAPEVVESEFRPLELIQDNHPKFVLSMDPVDLGRNGIQHRFLPDWLCERAAST